MATRTPKNIETLKHDDARRTNIPTAEYESVMAEEEKNPIRVAYERRNRDLDPQLVWRGKDEQDWSDLVVAAPPLYIQEKVHPKVLIDDLLRQSQARAALGQEEDAAQLDLFADFNGIPETATATEFYQHDANWTNRMILGDSLQVMASLAEREGLRGQVQCIYIDPPYGIKFNSNFQWSTTSRDVKDGNADHITREPEQVKAFRDTWRDGIHSYLTYLRDRLTVARDLLTESGSIFVQIGDENVHSVRLLLDEIFGIDNFVSLISYATTSGFASSKALARSGDYILWYAKSESQLKYRQLFEEIDKSESSTYRWLLFPDGYTRGVSSRESAGIEPIPDEAEVYMPGDLRSQGATSSENEFIFRGTQYVPGANAHWKTTMTGMHRLAKSGRIHLAANSIRYIRKAKDFAVKARNNFWLDTATGNFTDNKIYIVQTGSKVIERCILMTTDPGDLVLDPTCGSGTTAYVAEQWGRRWITIDTSRVSLALARARIMGARYPFYLLADSSAGQMKEAEISRAAPSTALTYGNIRHGFVYQRVPHIMLKDIANNTEIDIIWEQFQAVMQPISVQLSVACGLNKTLEEWEIPREAPADWPPATQPLLTAWWKERMARQQQMDASIAANAEQEFLYDKPYEDNKTVRVAGPFTVESLSPHRVLAVDENDELQPIHGAFVEEKKGAYRGAIDFPQVILENLKTAGVQQAHKEDRISFTALSGWPGHYLCAEGRYLEGENGKERRAGIFIGPEFGTVPRADLVAAAREAGDAGFDVLIACAFNYDAHSAEFEKLGRILVLKARMNADLHMADALKNTGAGNLFVIFGEPDIEIQAADDGQTGTGSAERIRVQIRGVDVFHPQSGQVHSAGPDDIALWFIDTDYNEESFFVRHAYFLGANDPYSALKTTLKAEIDEEAWASLRSDVSRPFAKPASGRIAVKVINHLGDEVMKVFAVR